MPQKRQPVRPHQRRSRSARGGRSVSMVEMIVVMTIIGVIAAIAVPRLSRGVGTSAVASMHQSLRVMRTSIELYWAEHMGVYPAAVGDGSNAAHTEAAFLRQMLTYTNAAGAAGASGSAAHPYGPYLRKGVPPLPLGPMRGNSTVHVVTGTTAPTYQPSGGVGWVYNDTSGQIVANIPDGTRDDLGADEVLRSDLETIKDTGLDVLGGVTGR